MIRLYGFADAEERDWFASADDGQGVGTKVALALLSALPDSRDRLGVPYENVTALSRANNASANGSPSASRRS